MLNLSQYAYGISVRNEVQYIERGDIHLGMPRREMTGITRRYGELELHVPYDDVAASEVLLLLQQGRAGRTRVYIDQHNIRYIGNITNFQMDTNIAYRETRIIVELDNIEVNEAEPAPNAADLVRQIGAAMASTQASASRAAEALSQFNETEFKEAMQAPAAPPVIKGRRFKFED